MSEEMDLELITPKIAEKYLNTNKSNRHLTEGHAEKMAADMTAGKWTSCYAPIIFYEDGDLGDGQHRLWAIAMSGVAQRFIVIRGVSREAGLNFDTGKVRTLVDNARISGADRELSNSLVATARAVEIGNRVAVKKGGSQSRALSISEQVEIVAKHREAAGWAVSHGPNGRFLRNAVVLGAIARAWYHEADKERLARFSEVLSKGFAENMGESAAIALRNYLQTKGQTATVGTEWRLTFMKTQNAIRYFMLGRQLTAIKVISDEAYPAPGHGQARSSRQMTAEKRRNQRARASAAAAA